jgi:hypothetical protein
MNLAPGNFLGLINAKSAVQISLQHIQTSLVIFFVRSTFLLFSASAVKVEHRAFREICNVEIWTQPANTVRPFYNTGVMNFIPALAIRF